MSFKALLTLSAPVVVQSLIHICITCVAVILNIHCLMRQRNLTVERCVSMISLICRAMVSFGAKMFDILGKIEYFVHSVVICRLDSVHFLDKLIFILIIISGSQELENSAFIFS